MNSTTLEAAGLHVWNNNQNDDIWKVYRLGVIPHNITTIEGENHKADAKSNITKVSDSDEDYLSCQIKYYYKKFVDFYF